MTEVQHEDTSPRRALTPSTASPKIQTQHARRPVMFSESERWSIGTFGSIASLGTRTLSLVPIGFALAIGGALFGSSTAVMFALGATSVVAFTLIDSVVSALVMQLTYNDSHPSIRSALLPLVSAHLTGNLFAAGLTGLSYGAILFVMRGAEALSPFVASGAIGLLQGMTLLGLLPVTVLSAAVSLLVPAYLVVEVLAQHTRDARSRPQVSWFQPSTSAMRSSLPDTHSGPWFITLALPELG